MSQFTKSNILIVDDDATICLLMSETLADGAYNVTAVNNGFDALDHIIKQQPDLVLLDVTMPGMDGFEVCTQIRKLYGDTNISIVMVTALEDAASVAKSYDVGATDFISKPINWDTFPYRIQYLIKARDAIVETQQHQLHLEYMEHVSRIITQNKSKDVIMQETMFAMLDIFSADRVTLLKPDDTLEPCYIVDCDTADNSNKTDTNHSTSIYNSLDQSLLHRASMTEYPIVTHYDSTNLPPESNQTLKQQMLTAIHLKDTQNWYLLVQQNSEQPNWTIPDEETFYKISLRLTNMLSRHMLTEELGRSETLLKQAQKIGRLGSWHWGVASRDLTWSDEVYHIYGYSRENYSPDINEYFEIEFDEDVDRLALLNNIQENIITSYQIDHRIRTAESNIKWTHEECIGIYDDSGKLLEINGIVQDITNSRIKKEQEVHNSKMEAIGQLTSGIAHDFGNLMTVAKGNLELLEESMLNDSNINHDNIELLEDSRSAVNDSVELTKQLLSFSRKKSIAPVFVNIKQTLERFNNLFKKTLGDTITMSVNVDDNLHDILVDPGQFESSLLNIIINARNAMPDGGEIKISASITPTTQLLEIIRNADNNLGEECVCISLKDNGAGMNTEVLERAIEPFYTTQLNQGTGLGLSMVYGFIKQSGGELVIRSKTGKGTTIHLQFPIYDGVATEKNITESKDSLQDIQATILIVEDRHAVRQFALRCLNHSSFTILQADNAASARKLLQSNHVDLLFTDIVMPGDMDGHKLANWANKEHPGLKILLTTAMEKITPDATETDIDNATQPDKILKHPVLVKPYSKNELIKNITRLLKHDTN